MNNLSTSETLNLAADLIEERGWTSYGGWPIDQSTDAHLCLEGGIMAALGMTWPEEDVEEEWERTVLVPCPAFAAVQKHLGMRPYWWNDEPGRTAAEVIEVLRATALVEAARETAGLPGAGLPGAPVAVSA